MNPEERPSRNRLVPRMLIAALAVIGVVALAAVAWNQSNDEEQLHEYAFPDGYIGPVTLNLSTDDSIAIRVEWGRLYTELDHQGGTVTYFFDRGTNIYGRSGPVLVTVQPPTEVEFGWGTAPADGVNIGATPWQLLEEPAGPAPRPATDDRPLAEAYVDETVSYGLLVEGVGLRSAPSRDGERVGAVHHGDLLAARCWTRSEELTSGNNQDPSDDLAQYTTDLWWNVQAPDTEAWVYISDVWYARADHTGRLNLTECT